MPQQFTPEQARTLGVDVSNDADQAGGLDESEITEAKRLVQGLPRQEQEEELVAAGVCRDCVMRKVFQESQTQGSRRPQ